jgi:hypothetical protein
MTTERVRQALAALAATEAAATPPPWEVNSNLYDPTIVREGGNWPTGEDDALGQIYSKADAAEIVVARNMHPGFLAQQDTILKLAEEMLQEHGAGVLDYRGFPRCGCTAYLLDTCPDRARALALVAAVTEALGGSE